MKHFEISASHRQPQPHLKASVILGPTAELSTQTHDAADNSAVSTAARQLCRPHDEWPRVDQQSRQSGTFSRSGVRSDPLFYSTLKWFVTLNICRFKMQDLKHCVLWSLDVGSSFELSCKKFLPRYQLLKDCVSACVPGSYYQTTPRRDILHVNHILATWQSVSCGLSFSCTAVAGAQTLK